MVPGSLLFLDPRCFVGRESGGSGGRWAKKRATDQRCRRQQAAPTGPGAHNFVSHPQQHPG